MKLLVWSSVLVIVAIGCTRSSTAAILSRDFLNSGDGLLTYDSLNEREWLDITETAGQSIDSIMTSLVPGGTLAEFSIASPEDIFALVESAGYDRSLPNHKNQFLAGNHLIDLLGESLRIDTEFRVSFDYPPDVFTWRISDGLVRDESSGHTVPIAVNTSGHLPTGVILFQPDIRSYVGPSQPYPLMLDDSQFRGVWLYRQAVPEPAFITMLCAAMSFICVRVRCWRRASRTPLALLCVLIAICINNGATAALISRDLQSQGDGKLTYDASNGREWLDLSETWALSNHQLTAALSSDGALYGFQFGSYDDVIQLAISGGFDPTSIPGGQEFDIVLEFIAKVSGQPVEGTFGTWIANGVVGPSFSQSLYTYVNIWAWWHSPDATNVHPSLRSPGAAIQAWTVLSETEPPPLFGADYWLGSVWLYRNATVPEPQSALMMLIILVMVSQRVAIRRINER